jgi:hypothetical protein
VESQRARCLRTVACRAQPRARTPHRQSSTECALIPSSIRWLQRCSLKVRARRLPRDQYRSFRQHWNRSGSHKFPTGKHILIISSKVSRVSFAILGFLASYHPTHDELVTAVASHHFRPSNLTSANESSQLVLP